MAKDIIKIDDDSFAQTIKSGVVLVDFYADWCGPCRMLTPILEALVNEVGDRVTVAKVDADHSPKTVTALQITSIPTMILYKDGQETQRIVGLKDLDTLKKMVS